MPKSKKPPRLPSRLKAAATVSKRNFEQWVEVLRRSDMDSYRIMGIEVWAIAKTMDNLFPGFWNRFMINRQLALKQFLEHKQAQAQQKVQQKAEETAEPGDAPSADAGIAAPNSDRPEAASPWQTELQQPPGSPPSPIPPPVPQSAETDSRFPAPSE